VTQDYLVPPVARLTAVPGSRLEQLQAEYESAKANFEDAKSRFEALTTALKSEMAAAAPAGSTDVLLNSAPGLPRLRMKWLRPYRFDAKRFRAEHPALYVRYEVRGGHWEMRAET
jgi:hypothetical protein